MTIDRVGHTSPISPSGADLPVRGVQAASASDRVQISAEAAHKAVKAMAVQAVNDVPDIRPEKVAEAKALLADVMQGSALRPDAAEKLAGILAQVLTRNPKA